MRPIAARPHARTPAAGGTHAAPNAAVRNVRFRRLKRDILTLSEWAITALSNAGVRGPVETGLKHFMGDSLNWKQRLLKTPGCGRRVLLEVERHAREIGIDTRTKLRPHAARILRSYKVETVEELRQFIALEPDWRMTLKVTRGCGRMTLRGIEMAASDLGIL
jgi:hypothetical protein